MHTFFPTSRDACYYVIKDGALGLLGAELEAMCAQMLPLGVDPARLQRLREQVGL